MNNGFEELEVSDTVRLEAKQLGLDMTQAKNIKAYNIVMDRVIIRFMNTIMVQKVEDIEYKYPKDWIQAFKERWFPEFILNRWPVIYTVKGHTVDIHYPEIAVPEMDYKVIRITKSY